MLPSYPGSFNASWNLRHNTWCHRYASLINCFWKQERMFGKVCITPVMLMLNPYHDRHNSACYKSKAGKNKILRFCISFITHDHWSSNFQHVSTFLYPLSIFSHWVCLAFWFCVVWTLDMGNVWLMLNIHLYTSHSVKLPLSTALTTWRRNSLHALNAFCLLFIAHLNHFNDSSSTYYC